jgi:hypothetical protein
MLTPMKQLQVPTLRRELAIKPMEEPGLVRPREAQPGVSVDC